MFSVKEKFNKLSLCDKRLYGTRSRSIMSPVYKKCHLDRWNLITSDSSFKARRQIILTILIYSVLSSSPFIKWFCLNKYTFLFLWAAGLGAINPQNVICWTAFSAESSSATISFFRYSKKVLRMFSCFLLTLKKP